MRLTQIMLSKGLGGAERSFVDLSLALVEAGHEVQAVCHRDFIDRARLGARSVREIHRLDAPKLVEVGLEAARIDFRERILTAAERQGCQERGDEEHGRTDRA